jgi:hypothetical protein
LTDVREPGVPPHRNGVSNLLRLTLVRPFDGRWSSSMATAPALNVKMAPVEGRGVAFDSAGAMQSNTKPSLLLLPPPPPPLLLLLLLLLLGLRFLLPADFPWCFADVFPPTPTAKRGLIGDFHESDIPIGDVRG